MVTIAYEPGFLAVNRVIDEDLGPSSIERGDKGALMIPGVPRFAVAYFAALNLGTAVVPLGLLLRLP